MAEELTIAYVAIGAHKAIREADQAAHRKAIDHHNGELGLIQHIIDECDMLDGMANKVEECFSGVYVYEVCEEFGFEYCREVIAEGKVSAKAIAELLIKSATGG